MALDPNIALGVRPLQLEMPNPLAQYGQIAAIQNAQNQNQLAQYQLGAAQRAEATQNVLANAYSQSIDPDTGTINYNKLTGLLAKGGGGAQIPGIEKTRREIEAAALTAKKTQGEIEKDQFKLTQDKLNYGLKSLGDSPTPQDAIKKLNEGVTKGYFDFSTANSEAQKLQSMTPEQYREYRIEKVLGLVDAKDKLGFMLPKTRDRDIGGQIQTIQDNPRLPGYGMPIAGGAVSKTQTFADLTAARQATTSAGQLNLAQQKFAFEQANPGFELKEAEDGSIVGVNKRTLQAFPVTVGGAAPAAAPMAQTGMPGARLPAPTGQAIPGMTSVLDQQAPAAAPAGGVPLMGKGTAMTETQSNAAMFGGAMAQAQNTIKQLEKSGTVKNAVVPGLLTGLAQMVPFGVGQGIGNVIESTFNADPTGLIGPNAAQQKLAQSQLAFATAYLRKTSGAAFGASEISNTIKEFFPLIGEGDKVIAQKAAARERAVEGMKISTTKEGRKYIEGYGGGGAPAAAGGGGIPNATPTNPLGLNVPGVR
jgi:hypothetical protein